VFAEARGEVDEALGFYDASEDAEAAYRADSLRLDERRYEELVRIAVARDRLPVDGTPLLEAALALGDRETIALFLSRTEASWAASSVRNAAVSFAEGGCEALLPHAAAKQASLLEGPVLERLVLCARELGRERDAAAWQVRAELARRGFGLQQSRRGIRAADGDNRGAAIAFLRRALRAHPGDRTSASRLIELLHARGEVEEAQRALEEALWSARFLPAGSDRELFELGAALGLRTTLPSGGSPPPAATLP
ncbi:MAG: hypothetical protein H5U40_05500, partial [Polyangiaceae bacterium]|nr:hypothetical protein [Polyangiaceae bacterium]